MTLAQILYAERAAQLIRSHDPDQSRLFLYVANQNNHGPTQAESEYLSRFKGVFSYKKRKIMAGVNHAFCYIN